MSFVYRQHVLVIPVKTMPHVFQVMVIISTIVTVPRGTKEVTAKQVNFRIELIKWRLCFKFCLQM